MISPGEQAAANLIRKTVSRSSLSLDIIKENII